MMMLSTLKFIQTGLIILLIIIGMSFFIAPFQLQSEVYPFEVRPRGYFIFYSLGIIYIGYALLLWRKKWNFLILKLMVSFAFIMLLLTLPYLYLFYAQFLGL